jgi:hypothetical protein
VNEGGGIFNWGNLTLEDVAVVDNQTTYNVSGASAGGGIRSRGDGGSVHASLHLIRTTVDNNRSRYDAGVSAIADSGYTVTIESSTISNNTALYTAGTNDGANGGLHVDGPGAVRVYNTTVSGNEAVYGGGVVVTSAASDDVKFINVTIVDNVATYSSGLYVVSGSTVEIHNTIVAENHTPTGGNNNVDGTLASNSSYNLIGLGGATGISDGDSDHNIVLSGSETAGIEPLADNGGPTWTHKLTATSQALDAGGYEKALEFLFDQRGSHRFDDSNGDTLVGIDIGAFELSADEYFEGLGA